VGVAPRAVGCQPIQTSGRETASIRQRQCGVSDERAVDGSDDDCSRC